ncbi:MULTISPECIES: hypothetical protein [Bacteria]|uniref:hypothetical protein n=1 Tax=Pseudomonadati TaxID=3379134 RepID=UPI000223D0E6|nr:MULTISPECIES: hypothetical protein [Bacteria]AEN74736.1 hypothetical protein Rhom172_2856 [Rhodothermus marinus SG0.5JP17-172]
MKYDPPVTYQILLVIYGQSRNISLARQLEASEFMAMPVGPHLVAVRHVELEAYAAYSRLEAMRREVRARLEQAGYSGFLRWEPVLHIDVMRRIEPVEDDPKQWAYEILRKFFNKQPDP